VQKKRMSHVVVNVAFLTLIPYLQAKSFFYQFYIVLHIRFVYYNNYWLMSPWSVSVPQWHDE
jgi:hypothetical protein